MATSTRTRRPARSAPKVDVYQVITDKIIAMLDAGTAPWHKPWSATSGMPLSMSSGKHYRGINVWLLGMEAMAKGYTSPWWGTYNQIAARGGQVAEGQTSTQVILWKPILKIDEASGKKIAFFMLRTFNVFNAEQTEDMSALGLPEQDTNVDNDNEAIAECEGAVRQYLAAGPSLANGGDRAYYSPSQDHVQMPERDAFDDSARYYGALFHELTHSTGHATRLARPDLMEAHAFGDESYSREELVAEMGASFLSGITGIDVVTLPNSAAYLESWITVLQGDNKLIIKAAAAAQKAAELILGVTHEDKSAD
jgi:antirestriction protein ArdC